MSDPRYTDPRLADPPLREENRVQRLGELESSNNAMWGWIAGGIVLALLLVFVFGRSPNTTDSASNVSPQPPAATTGMAPPRAPAPSMTQVPRPMPSTTGSSSNASTPSTSSPANPAPSQQ